MTEDEKKIAAIEESMKAYGSFTKSYDDILYGAVIQEFIMWDDADDITNEPRMALLIKTKDGRLFTIHVDRDAEGNGPGWLSLHETHHN